MGSQKSLQIFDHRRKYHRWFLPLEIKFKQKFSPGGVCAVKDTSVKGIRFEADDNPQFYVGTYVKFAIELPKSLKAIKKTLKHDKSKGNVIDGHIVRKVPLSRTRADYAVLFAKEYDEVGKIANKLDPRPISPWINPKLEDKVIQIISNTQSDIPKFERQNVDRWLSQFSNKRIRHTMLQLLEVICSNYLFNSRECHRLAHVLFTLILPLARGNFYRLRIMSLGPESKGGGYVRYLMRVVNSLPIRIFPGTVDKLRLDLKNDTIDVVAFVDDFFGTGDTAVQALGRRFDELKIEQIKNSHTNFVACALVGYDNATERISKYITKKNPGQLLRRCGFVANPLRNSEDRIFKLGLYKPLNKDHTLLNKEFGRRFFSSQKEAQEVYRECFHHDLYHNDGIPRPLGYSNLASPVVFYYNTPNDGLPLFWYDAKLWQPIFPRRSIRDYGSWKPPCHRFGDLVGKQAQEIAEKLKNENLFLLIEGESGSGKFLLSSTIANEVLPHRNVFWFECTEHSTADSLRNQLERYLDQCLPSDKISEKLKKVLDTSTSETILISKINELKPLLVFHHLDFSMKALLDLKAWDIQRQKLRQMIKNIVHFCNSNTAILLTANNIEKVRNILKVIPPKLKPVSPKQSTDYFYSKLFKGITKGQKMLSRFLQKKQISPFGAALGNLLIKNKYLNPQDFSDVSDNKFLDVFFSGISKPTQKILLCAAAIRSHRTDGIIAKIAGIVYPTKLDIITVHNHAERLEREWRPLIYRDDSTGELIMSDKLRAYLYEEKIEKDFQKQIVWHKAIAEVYADLEASDWTEKIEFVAVSIDHYIKSSDKDCILQAVKRLIELRPFFTKYGKLQQYGHLVSALLEAARKYIDNTTENRKITKAYIKLSLELLRAYRRYSEFTKMQELCEKTKKSFEWIDDKILLSRIELFRSVLHVVQGQFQTAITHSNSATQMIIESKRNKRLLRNYSTGNLVGSSIRCLLRTAQSQLSLSNYFEATIQLEATVTMLKELGSRDNELVVHSLAVLTRHFSTLFYLDHDALSALKWAKVSHSLNKELSDLEGQAVSLIKISLVWSLLGDTHRALNTAEDASDILKRNVPEQIWWMLASEKASCLAHIRRLQSQWEYSNLTRQEIGQTLNAIFKHTKNMRRLLNKAKHPWLCPWGVELDILEAKAQMWKNNMPHLEKAWKTAWQEANRHESSDGHGHAPHIRSLLAYLGCAMIKEKKSFKWMQGIMINMQNPQWQHYAIYCFMEAVDRLTRTLLFRSQEWFLQQIINISNDDSVPNDRFINAVRMWANYRLNLRNELLSEASYETAGTLSKAVDSSPLDFSTAVGALLRGQKLDKFVITKANANRFREMHSKLKAIDGTLMTFVKQ